MHIERLGTPEVEGILDGEVYVFPKLDGSNGQVWMENGEIKCGSRNRVLSLENDNQGFCAYVMKHEGMKRFFKAYPHITLYGEWLVPHSLRTYEERAWGEFYVFDVHGRTMLIDYGSYIDTLDFCDIKYIPCIAVITNPTLYDINECVNLNTFLIKPNSGIGEGVVIKNYNFVNKYGRTTWAKVVTEEFKQKNREVFPKKEKEGVEQKIISKYVTSSLVEKEYSKICNEQEWNSKLIPKLLGVVYYSLVKEESYNFIKEFKNPTINFKTLLTLTNERVKELKPEIF